MDDLEHQDKGQDDVACDYPCFHLLKPFLIPMTPANRDTENKASEEQADEVCDLLQHCASSDPRVSLQSRLAFLKPRHDRLFLLDRRLEITLRLFLELLDVRWHLWIKVEGPMLLLLRHEARSDGVALRVAA